MLVPARTAKQLLLTRLRPLKIILFVVDYDISPTKALVGLNHMPKKLHMTVFSTHSMFFYMSGLFLFSVLLICQTPIRVTSSRLLTRQEPWPDSPIPAIWNGVGSLLNAGADVIQNLFLSPSSSDLFDFLAPPAEPETTPPPESTPETGIASPADADPELNSPVPIVGPSGGLENQPSSPQRSSVDNECDHTPVPFQDSGDVTPSLKDPCDVATDQLIYASNCASTIQNENIAKSLNEMKPPGGVHASEVRKCGVFFWTAALTLEQTTLIRAMEGVLGVAPDEPLVSDRFPSTPRKVTNRPRKRGDQREKRNGFVVVQPNSLLDLAFISTSPDSVMTQNSKYTYFSNAGETITVYSLDGAVDTAHPEFRPGQIKHFLYGMDVDRTKDTTEDHATCIASKIGGIDFGVAKKVSLVIGEMTLRAKSFLSLLREVLNDLDRRVELGEVIPGYTVVTISSGWATLQPLHLNILELLIKEVLDDYQVVVVVSAGDTYFSTTTTTTNADIFEWPALLTLKPNGEFPIITVGAVLTNGHTTPTSNGGIALTVSAPGEVTCAGVEGRTITGGTTSFAAPSVAGLAAYLLSVYPHLRERGHVPRAVRDLIVDNAYVRPGGTEKAVWNLVYPDSRPGSTRK